MNQILGIKVCRTPQLSKSILFHLLQLNLPSTLTVTKSHFFSPQNLPINFSMQHFHVDEHCVYYFGVASFNSSNVTFILNFSGARRKARNLN